MTQSLVGIELENGGVLLRFVETAAENGGARHVQEARYAPRSSPPPYHRHPKQAERFEILEVLKDFISSHIRSHDDDGVLKVGDSSFVICESAII